MLASCLFPLLYPCVMCMYVLAKLRIALDDGLAAVSLTVTTLLARPRQGVTPARDYLKRILRNGFGGDVRAAAKRLPTLFWFLPPEVSPDR